MKELQDIIKKYENANEKNLKSSLVTVVHLDGSSYRRPGARMLVNEDGKITGAISGGCLEGDAQKKALFEGSFSHLCFIMHLSFMVGFHKAFNDTVLAIAFTQVK